MGHLIDLIDDYRDRHGQPSEASIGRAIGVSDKTVNAWRQRGIKQFPKRETLANLSKLLNVPYSVVFEAVAQDTGYLDLKAGDGHGPEPRSGPASISDTA